MNKQQIILCYSIIILLISSCDQIPTKLPEFNREISIVGILDNSQQPQKIYAYYTAKLDEETEAIHNAIVKIYSEMQQVTLTFCTDSIFLRPRFYYCDRPETLHVFPEAKYHLKLITADGDSVKGETIVPGQFTITTPAAKSLKVDKSLLIEWTASKSAYGYIINLFNPPTEYPPGSGHFIYYEPESYQTSDTTYTLYRDYGFKKGAYTIKVMAYDQNYHYHHAEGISSCGLVGGYGVFGSGVIDSVVFTIE